MIDDYKTWQRIPYTGKHTNLEDFQKAKIRYNYMRHELENQSPGLLAPLFMIHDCMIQKNEIEGTIFSYNNLYASFIQLKKIEVKK